MKDAKYLLAFAAPVFVFFGIYLGGIWSFGSVFLAFGIIPLLELVLPGNTENLSDDEELSQNKKRFFDFLLYVNFPVQYGLILYFFVSLATRELQLYEIIGMTMNVGIMNGYCINVAHELGHRLNNFDRFMCGVLLLPSLYLHFLIEHNLGHHKNVSTDKDPASSRFNESIYAFYFRSVTMSYLHAWEIERGLLAKAKKAFYSLNNRMFQYLIIQTIYLVLVFSVFGGLVLAAAIFSGIMGFLLLESVNYIEHYGLRRKKLPSGRYEPVQEYHSWNSNHELGRIFLFELTRHSDHHFKSTRKYQVLRHFDESPQLPQGYPGCIIMALIPPLWFHKMNKEVLRYTDQMQHKVDLAIA